MWHGVGSRGAPFAIMGEAINIFASARRLLTNTFYYCIQTFRAITDYFDRLVGVQSLKIGPAAGSGVNRKGSLGQLSQRFERGQNFAAQSISISRG